MRTPNLKFPWKLFTALVLCHGLATAISAEDAVPRLIGQRLNAAEQIARLKEFQLITGIFYIAPRHWRDDIQPEVTYLQSPQPSLTFPHSREVATWKFVKADKDQKITKAPDLTSLKASEVAQLLANHNLIWMKPSASVPGATAIDQYPMPGQPIYEGTGVYVFFEAE